MGSPPGPPLSLSLSLSLTTDGGTEWRGAKESKYWAKKRPASASLTRRPTVRPMGEREGGFLVHY